MKRECYQDPDEAAGRKTLPCEQCGTPTEANAKATAVTCGSCLLGLLGNTPGVQVVRRYVPRRGE
jgi:hypothetical protein